MRELTSEMAAVFGPGDELRVSRGALARLTRAMVRTKGAASMHAVRDWIGRFGELSVEGREGLSQRLEDVIACQLRVGDLGSASIRGEPYLVAVEERRFALPDGTVVLLGSQDESEAGRGLAAGMFPRVEGQSDSSLLDFFADRSPSVITLPEPFAPMGTWPGPGPLPNALADILSLCGECDPDEGTWHVAPETAAFLKDLFGGCRDDPSEAGAVGGAALDADQERVCKAPASERLVVEAAPGSGKTHTACARVARLLNEEGLEGSSILLLSFTRIAVAELRSRIAAEDVPGAQAVEVSTFDSLAGRYRAGLTGIGRGHDATVRAATRRIADGDPGLVGDVRSLRHLIIDEAQDLVGPRREFCEALIAALHPKCGVTVFGDPAQAIFAFQAPDADRRTLFSDLTDRPGFRRAALLHDHRSESPALARFVRDARPALLTPGVVSKQAYFDVRKLIEENAVESGLPRCASHPSTSRGLVLVRSHSSLLTLAEDFRSAGRSFRLRLPGRPLRVEPWIGAMLGGLPENTTLDRGMVEVLHADMHPRPALDPAGCWEVLRDLDGMGRATVRVGRIAEALLDPPLALLRDHEGSSGPLLSTIHGVKGHEDTRVMLGLTRAPRGEDVDWPEEARILYVGATRAKLELRSFWINPRKYWTIGSPKRYWAVTRDHRRIEVGLEQDLAEWQDFRAVIGSEMERQAIKATWAVSEGSPAVARLGQDGLMRVHAETAGGPALACLSGALTDAIRKVTQIGDDAPLPNQMTGFDIVGATTVVVPARAGGLPTLALLPLLGGFGRIARD